jgi:DNA polymerase-3 subunit delta'
MRQEMTGHSLLCYTKVLGHEKAKRMVRRSLSGGRVPHAYIFKGPDGVGRKLFARGLAAALNCRAGGIATACEECASCRKYISGNHPDFLVVSPERNGISIGRIRELGRELTYPPYESDLRVVVLEDVHLMRREAANSLLKTLEEPPENNLLILTAESSREILPTLISRCQVVPFFALSEDEILSLFEHLGIDGRNSSLYARFSEGSPGKALMLKQTSLIEIWRDVVELLSDESGSPQQDLGRVLKLAEKMAVLKDDLGDLLIFLKMWLRDLLVWRQNGMQPGKGLAELPGNQGKLLKSWSSGHVFAKLQAVEMAEKALARNCNRLLVCEIVLFRLLESGKTGVTLMPYF